MRHASPEPERATVVSALLAETARELVGTLDAAACLISRVLGDVLIEVAEYAPSGQTLLLGHGYLVPDFPLTEAVLELREPRAVSLLDPDADPTEAAILREHGFDSLLMLALQPAEARWGLVELYGAGGRPFDAAQTGLAEAIVERAARALEAALAA